jgi:hypothetical protein
MPKPYVRPMVVPPEVLEGAANWDHLSRWERAELGRRLRREGWTYSEIMAVLPVGKGTLSGWCREIRLTEEQIQAIKARVPTQKGVPRDTNRKRRHEIAQIRKQAQAEVPQLLEERCGLPELSSTGVRDSKLNDRSECPTRIRPPYGYLLDGSARTSTTMLSSSAS